MKKNQSNAIESAVDPLIDFLEERLLPRLRERLTELVVNSSQQAELPPRKRLYSLRDLAEIYGVGRSEATRLIHEGSLRCVERRCRGGQIGIFIPIEEAERRFAGVGK